MLLSRCWNTSTKSKEERSGVSRNSQGLNPDILQNVTATAVAQVTQGSQSRLEMISRVLAWGVKSHFKKNATGHC
ncbi:portal protein [Kiloniella litopenaei]|uniref:portal protein n=1 Tax=Kiloniella litopenaei TaxID=1549748 RepID=UPI003BABB4B1